MREWMCVLVALTLVISVARPSQSQEQIEWFRSAEAAAQAAAQENRPILVYVRSANCHYCDLMQQKVWQDPETVARINREFVPLKLTQEENKEAVEAMKVKGFPATLIFTASRKFAHRVTGYVAPDKFRLELDKAQQSTRVASLNRPD